MNQAIPQSLNQDGLELIDSPHFVFRISQLLFNRPLLAEQSEVETVLAALGSRVGVAAAVSPQARVRSGRSERALPDDSKRTTAVIPVVGPLVHRRMGSALSGGPTTYGEIRTAFREALRDPEIGAIMLDIDSGGGEVSGAFDLVDEIYRARQEKPVYAYVNESAFSAAYALASATEKVWMPRTGAVGSIGVIALHRDETARDMQEGIKYTPIYAGEAKYDFSPHAPLNERARAVLQAQVNEIFELFVQTVGRNRALAPETVRNTNARIYQGPAALELGLVDEILTFDEALERTFENHSAEGVQAMSDGNLKGIEDRLAALEAENARLKGELESKAGNDGNGSEGGYKYEILNACLACGSLLGNPQKFAEELIAQKVSLAEAQNRIIKAVSERQSKEEIRASVGAEGYGDINPLDQAVDTLIAQMPKRQ